MRMISATVIFIRLFIIIVFICFVSNALADKVILKNGKVIEGKITEETDEYIKIEIKEVNIPITYYKDEIERIEKTEGRASAESKDSSIPIEHPDIKKYKELIEKEPNNYKHYLALASMYGSIGEGDLTVEYAEKAIKLNPEAAINEGVYMMAAMGSYYAGKPGQSYEYTEKALKVNPNDEMAKGFKDMLDTVKEQQWAGNLPERVTFGGYDSAAEAGRALTKEGTVALGEKEDKFVSDALNFHVSGPKNWHKASNITLPSGISVLIIYQKFKDNTLPSIGITKDLALPGDKAVIDFTRRVKQDLSNSYPDMIFDGPYQVTINGRVASRMEFRVPSSGLNMEWYQFLEQGIIITFNYTNTLEDFEADYDTFKEVLNSFVVE